jgi:hypothetical protein
MVDQRAKEAELTALRRRTSKQKMGGQKMKDTRGNCLNFVLGLLFSARHFFAFFLAKYPQAGLSSISSSSDPYH